MLNKENKKIMEVFFLFTDNKGRSFVVHLYIIFIFRGNEDNIHGVRGSWHTPPDVRGIGSHPK